MRKWKFKIEWNFYEDCFFSVGFLIGKNYIGFILFNLFVGLKQEIDWVFNSNKQQKFNFSASSSIGESWWNDEKI